MIFILFLPLTGLLAFSMKKDFVDHARLFIYKKNLLGASLWETASFTQWNSLINVTSNVDPVIDKLFVDNLTINDVPDWIPSDYNTVIDILKMYKMPKFLSEDKDTELYSLLDNLTNSYISAKVCAYRQKDDAMCVPTMQMEEIRSTTESRDEKQLLYYWKAWREETGKKMKHDYERFSSLKNEESRLNGYQDAGHEWRAEYETECLRQETDKLWQEVRPLYEQLHAYVRRKLIQKYGGIIKSRGPIPAHLLTYTMEEMWLNIEKFTRPYPGKPALDVTDVMRRKNMTATDMVSMADYFFVSMGMDPMTATFWKESIFEKRADRPMDCYPVSLDMGKEGAHRTRFCSLVRLEDLFIIIHEMGHIHYFRESEFQPILRYRIPNSALHEAIGGTVALSVLNPIYLNEIGLMEDFVDGKEQDINFLYALALMRVGTLSHMYVVDNWRWDVFDGTVTHDLLNTKWWEYRSKLQGHCPPVRRTEKDFDAGAMYLVARHVPSMSYFIANILEFQFHKALCDAKGHVGPLHKCTVHNSTEAGERLRSMLRLGASVSWRSAIRNITNNETDQINAKPLLEFFSPLWEWLKTQNAGDLIGWENNDPTICP